MLNPERKIGKKLHSFSFSGKEMPGFCYEPFEIEDKRILKYAPKDLDYLVIRHWKNAKLMNALKRVKKVRSISHGLRKSPRNECRLALQNKFKSIQEFDQSNDRKEILEKYKAFSMMRKVKLEGGASFLLSVLRYMPGLTNLKSFSLQFDSNDGDPEILKRLNSMSRTLSSLKTMEISWLSEEEEESKVSFSRFVENKNILRTLTHLSIKEESENDLSQYFEILPVYCKRLIDLELILLDADENMRVLKSLKDFENLEKIKITSYNIFSFLDNLTLPYSTKEVFFEFEKISENQLELFTQFPEKTLAKEPSFTRFFDQWSHLQNLISLAVQLQTDDPNAISLILTFLSLILQRTPSLVNFDLDFDRYCDYDDCFDPINLTNILRSLQKFSDSLQTISLKIPYSYSLAQQDISFPKLTHFHLNSGLILDLGTIQNIFSVLKRPVSEKRVEISLGNYMTNSNQALLDLLQLLRKPPRNSKVEFKIEVEKLDFDMFYWIFEDFMEEAQRTPVVQNVSLSIAIVYPYGEKEVKALAFLKEVFQEVALYGTIRDE